MICAPNNIGSDRSSQEINATLDVTAIPLRAHHQEKRIVIHQRHHADLAIVPPARTWLLRKANTRHPT